MTKIKATNREMLETLQGLYSVQDLKGVKFAVAVSKNIERLKTELLHIDEASKPTPEFQKLLDKAKTFEDEKDIKKLEKENKSLIDERKAQLAEVDEIELVTMSEQNLPQDITAKQLGTIIKLVNN